MFSQGAEVGRLRHPVFLHRHFFLFFRKILVSSNLTSFSSRSTRESLQALGLSNCATSPFLPYQHPSALVHRFTTCYLSSRKTKTDLKNLYARKKTGEHSVEGPFSVSITPLGRKRFERHEPLSRYFSRRSPLGEKREPQMATCEQNRNLVLTISCSDFFLCCKDVSQLSVKNFS